MSILQFLLLSDNRVQVSMAHIIKEREPTPPWRIFRARARYRWMRPIVYTDWLLNLLADALSRWALLEVLEYAGSFSVLIAVIFYFADSGNRRLQRHYQAWQVIDAAQGKSGNGGRMEALNDLYRDNVSLIGVDLSNAYLGGIKLDGANLHRADFSAADMRNVSLRGVDLTDANLNSANFRNADLRGVDFSGDVGAEFTDADLTGADLRGSNLYHANLTRTDLTGANFADVVGWQSIRLMDGANIHNIVGAPPGFVKWALAHGAVDVDATTQP
jgi:hypothetical protein